MGKKTTLAFILILHHLSLIDAQSYKVLNKIFDDLTKGYNKAVRPNGFGSELRIGIAVHLMGIPNVDDEKMEFSLDMYFRQFWKDDRLKFSTSGQKLKDASLKERLWTPDPFFVNQKEGKILDNPADNTLFRLDPNGDIVYSSRQLVTTYCTMDLSKYPFDSQKCSLEIESFAHTLDELRYFWKDGNSSVSLADKLYIPTFEVLGHSLSETTVSLSTGKYNRLHMTFYLRRKLGNYLKRNVFPATVAVLISSLAFWIHPLQHSGSRAIILFLSIFLLLALYIKSNSSLIVGYLTTSDDFFFVCFGFLTVNILIFLMLLIIRRCCEREKYEEDGEHQSYCLKRLVWMVDAIARIIFAPAFIAYVIIFMNRTPVSAYLEEPNFIPYNNPLL